MILGEFALLTAHGGNDPNYSILAGNTRVTASPRETNSGKVAPLIPAKRNWLPKREEKMESLAPFFCRSGYSRRRPSYFFK